MIGRWISGIVAAIVVAAALGSWWVFATVSHSGRGSAETKSFVVAKGEGVRTISARLYQEGYISSRQAWTLYVIMSGLRYSILADTYSLSHTFSGKDIAHTFTTGATNSDEVTVVVREGMTVKEIGKALAAVNVVSAEAFLEVVTHPGSSFLADYPTLADKPPSVDLEGYIFPDTYRFFHQTSATAVLKKFLDNFERRYDAALRAETTAAGHTIFQTITMASIVEAELRSAEDRAMAADIFWRRAKAGMALNADTTVHYAVGNKNPLSLNDLTIDSPYNTYIHPGLPVGPIGNPGLVSIKAALRPKANEYWYYLTAKDGRTIYATTLEEHNKNKAQYLK